MTMNDSDNQQSHNGVAENGMGAMHHRRPPIIINRVNVVIDRNRMAKEWRAHRFSDARISTGGLSRMGRKAHRLFHRGLPRFNDAQLSPEEKRSMLEQQEKWLQKRLDAVQSRLKATK